MSKHTKKWEKEFEKRYSNAITELKSLEQEYKEMTDTNPDKWISLYPKHTNIDFGEADGFNVYYFKENENEQFTKEHIDVTLNSQLGQFGFFFTSFDKLIELRDDLIKAVDKFQRPIEKEKNIIDPNDDCDDYDNDTEEQEFTVKAEQPLTQCWTYTVKARSACEAVKKVEEDNYGPDITNNDDNEYYDYGDIEYEVI